MESLWEAWVESLEGLIRRFGLARMVVALSGLAGALLGLGIAVSESVLLVAAGCYLVCLLFVTALALAIDRRRLYGRLADASLVLDRYADDLVNLQDPTSFDIEDWEEEVVVAKNGDADIVRWFELVVGPRSLHTFWHRCWPDLPPNGTGYQSEVHVEARAFEVTDHGRELRTRYPVTTKWENHSLRIFVHLYEPQAPRAKLWVRLRITWPRYHKKMLDDGAVEDFEWTFRRVVKRLKTTMTFKDSIGLAEPFLAQSIGHHKMPTQTRRDDGTVIVEYEHESPPQDVTFGFRLERHQR